MQRGRRVFVSFKLKLATLRRKCGHKSVASMHVMSRYLSNLVFRVYVCKPLLSCMQLLASMHAVSPYLSNLVFRVYVSSHCGFIDALADKTSLNHSSFYQQVITEDMNLETIRAFNHKTSLRI